MNKFTNTMEEQALESLSDAAMMMESYVSGGTISLSSTPITSRTSPTRPMGIPALDLTMLRCRLTKQQLQQQNATNPLVDANSAYQWNAATVPDLIDEAFYINDQAILIPTGMVFAPRASIDISFILSAIAYNAALSYHRQGMIQSSTFTSSSQICFHKAVSLYDLTCYHARSMIQHSDFFQMLIAAAINNKAHIFYRELHDYEAARVSINDLITTLEVDPITTNQHQQHPHQGGASVGPDSGKYLLNIMLFRKPPICAACA